MSKRTRDLSIIGGLAAVLLVSLMLVRLTTADPAPSNSSAADPAPSNSSVIEDTFSAAATDPPALDSPRPPAPSTVTSTPTSSPDTRRATGGPRATLVLSSGVPVVPHPVRAPQTYRPAPTTMPAALPTPPPDPDPAVFSDPARLGTAWLSALCWYDYRAERDENTRRAGVFGDIGMPPGQNPWTLDNQAWARVTAAHLGSGCTDIAATIAQTSHDTAEVVTVTLTATQVLTVDGNPYQAVPIALTRTLQQDSDGRWLIGSQVSAN